MCSILHSFSLSLSNLNLYIDFWERISIDKDFHLAIINIKNVFLHLGSNACLGKGGMV